MKQQAMAILLAQLLFFFSNGHAQSSSPLDGAYERVSLTNVRTGESPEAADRQGLLLMGSGHYSMMTMQPDRRVLGADEKLEDMSPADQVTYLQEWLDINAHSGRYAVEGDTLIWYRDISEDPKEVGSESRLSFEQRDDRLVIFFTLPNGDRYDWIWRRLQ